LDRGAIVWDNKRQRRIQKAGGVFRKRVGTDVELGGRRTAGLSGTIVGKSGKKRFVRLDDGATVRGSTVVKVHKRAMRKAKKAK
jgi:hypothetical protein